MFLLISLPVGLIVGYLIGGRAKNLSNLELRSLYLPLFALTLQILLFSGIRFVQAWPISWRATLHIASYALLVAFFIRNFRIRGITLIGLGMMLNLLAIAANGGFMPTTETALSKAGLESKRHLDDSSLSANNAVKENPRFLFLGDIFAIPKGLPLSNVFSIGDLVIGVGAVVGIASAMRRHRPEDAVRYGCRDGALRGRIMGATAPVGGETDAEVDAVSLASCDRYYRPS